MFVRDRLLSAMNYFYSDDPAAEGVIDMKKPFDPANENHVAFIKNKIACYKVNRDAVMSDFNYLWMLNAAFFGVYKLLLGPLLAIPFLVAGLPVDIYYSWSLGMDFIKRYPTHFVLLKELTEIGRWMTKEQDIKFTKNPTFLSLVKAIAPLVPLEEILYYDPAKIKPQDIKDLSEAYLHLLSLPPHNKNYISLLANKKPGSVEKNENEKLPHAANQMLAQFNGTLFGLGASRMIADVQKIATLLPAPGS